MPYLVVLEEYFHSGRLCDLFGDHEETAGSGELDMKICRLPSPSSGGFGLFKAVSNSKDNDSAALCDPFSPSSSSSVFVTSLAS